MTTAFWYAMPLSGRNSETCCLHFQGG